MLEPDIQSQQSNSFSRIDSPIRRIGTDGAFLNPSNGDLPNPLLTAREYDSESQSYYYRARQYNQFTGHFLSADPIGYSAGINLYSYGENNTVNAIDPWGLWSVSEHDKMLEEAVSWAFVGYRIGPWDPKEWTCAEVKKCEKWVKDKLKESSADQDKGKNFEDNEKHFNRRLNTEGKEYIQKYKAYLADKEKDFTDSLNLNPPNCEEALDALGRLGHSWEDFFEHAMSVKGTILRNDKTWTEQGEKRPPITPDNIPEDLIKPSSWSNTGHTVLGLFFSLGGLLFRANEHGVLGAVTSFSGKEGELRKDAAIKFTANKFDSMLPTWLEKCKCKCPPKK